MSFNKIIIIGNLGRDPELRYTPQGDAVCDFSVAVNDRKKDKSGEMQESVTWFRVTLWRRMAENASKYLTKGKPVYIEGRLQVEEWQDRDGKDRYTLNITATDMHFLGGARDDDFADTSDNVEQLSDSKATSAGAVESTTPAEDDIPF